MGPKKVNKTAAGSVKSQPNKRQQPKSKAKAPPIAEDDDGMIVDESPAVRSKPAKQALAKKTLKTPMDIAELRNKIYDELLGMIPSDGDFDATILTLDSNGDLVEDAMDGNNTKTLYAVGKSGVAKIFKLSLAQLKPHFTEFLSENAPEMTFLFMDPDSLDNFAELLRALLTTPKGVQPMPITVAISLFSDRKTFKKMAEWKELSMAHGYKANAESHIKRWMDAVQLLPKGVKLILSFNQPWFDYRSLRGVTACLRSPDAVCTTDVAVSKSAWEGIPESEFHLKMTVVSIKGGETPPVNEAAVDDMLAHGCRGFRGQV